MTLVDVNVLVNAFRADAADHDRYEEWLGGEIGGPSAFGYSDHVLCSFLRVVTNRHIYAQPAPIAEALRFADAIRERPNAVAVTPGPRHWGIFVDLCRATGARGGLVPDAWLAALAIESGCEWITADRDFARFPGLRWRHPFDEVVVRERPTGYEAPVRRRRAARKRH